MQLPAEFAARMQWMLGTEYEEYLRSYDRPKSPSLRISASNSDSANVDTSVLACLEGKARPDVHDIAAGLPWDLKAVPWAVGGYSYAEADRPGKHAFHEAGVYYIQEASAMSVAALSGTVPGERVLDLCAAPGGKSTQLAAMLQGKGLLVSNEIGPTRARILSQNIERMGIANAIVTNETPAHLADRFSGYFDRVIVDAPCSGEGMFRSKDEALPLWSQAHVYQCAARQQDILDEAARMVAPGGTLVYSTCTFAPEEDEESVAAFLTAHPDYELVDLPAVLGDSMQAWGFDAGRPDYCRETITYPAPQGMEHTDDYVSPRYDTSLTIPVNIREQLVRALRLFPHKMGGEGHFLAVLQRAGTRQEHAAIAAPAKKVKKDVRRGKSHGADPVAVWKDWAAENLQVNLAERLAEDCGSVYLPFGDELYLEPAGISLTGLKVLRPGLHLGTIKKDRFEPSQALAEYLCADEAIRVHDIPDSDPEDSRDAAAYLRGESIPCDPSLKGWTLVTVSDRAGHRYSLAWGKAAQGILKNHYPKGLRRPY